MTPEKNEAAVTEFPQTNDHAEMKRLLEENLQLAKDNNALLTKLHRNSVIEFWIRVVWYAVLIGLPFALYFYILEPYFEAFGSNYEVFRAGIAELPGLKGLEKLLPSFGQ